MGPSRTNGLCPPNTQRLDCSQLGCKKPRQSSLIRQKGDGSLGIADHELRFRQWLGEHTGLLLKVVRSFAEGPADQDDLFQEILLQVWLSLPNFREDSKPTTWLYRVAFNTALAWKRTEKKRWRRHGSLSISDVAVPTDSSAERERNNRIRVQPFTAHPFAQPRK